MKSTTKLVLLLILSTSWVPVVGQNVLKPDTLGPYSVHGYMYNQQHMPLTNVRLTITNWGEKEFADNTDESGYFSIEFPVKKLDYQYNRQVHIELSTMDAAYLKKSISIPIRRFTNGQYLIESTQLNARLADNVGPGIDWGLIDSLQSRIDSLQSLLESYAKYPGKIDSLRARIAALQSQRDGELQEYIVKKGDYLIKIASERQFYDDPEKWQLIYEANREIIDNPNLIYPKQVLKIPPPPTDGE